MPPSPWLLGIDLGASSLKCTRLEIDSLRVTTVRYPLITEHPHPGWAQQQPQSWLDALSQLLTQLDCVRNPPQALAISGGAHIPVLLDSKLQPLYPAIMWSDLRSANQVSELTEYKTLIEDLCLNTPSTTWSLPMLRWLAQNEPIIHNNINRIVFAKDYLRLALTGTVATDPGDATGSMLADSTMHWHPQLCELAGITPEQLPRIAASTDVVGTTTNALPIAPGIPVLCGSIDTSTELLSAGVLAPDQQCLKLATAGVFSWVVAKAYANVPVSCYPHIQHPLSYFATGNNNCMGAISWFGKTFVNGGSLADIDVLASQAGASCPLFHPYLYGERAPLWNPHIRAGFTGFDGRHTIADFAAAVFRGVCYALRMVIEYSGVDADVHPLPVIGGGTNSPVLTATLATVLGRPITIHHQGDASVGSALLAGSYDVFPDISDIPTIGKSTVIEPNTAQIPMYNTEYQQFISTSTFFDTTT